LIEGGRPADGSLHAASVVAIPAKTSVTEIIDVFEFLIVIVGSLQACPVVGL
jgi:hypothetical protein